MNALAHRVAYPFGILSTYESAVQFGFGFD